MSDESQRAAQQESFEKQNEWLSDRVKSQSATILELRETVERLTSERDSARAAGSLMWDAAMGLIAEGDDARERVRVLEELLAGGRCDVCDKPNSYDRICARCGLKEGSHASDHPHDVTTDMTGSNGIECDGFVLSEKDRAALGTTKEG